MRAGIALLSSLLLVGWFGALPAAAAPREAPVPLRHDEKRGTVAQALRDFAAAVDPEATAAQAARYGLHFPDPIDEGKPLVVLVHGLDCDRVHWGGMAQRLLAEGYQLAFFNYPSDQAIADSAALFGRKMTVLRRAYPRLGVNVVAYSMGGLVSRAYVEGPDYAGGVERLILVGTPNRGSGWARMRGVLELQEHYYLWRDDPDWSPTWMITDGLGEAGRDLKPGSKFLKSLNALPRRDGVKYTIICGDQSSLRRVGSGWLESAAHSIPRRAGDWWGVRQVKQRLTREADHVFNRSSAGDGPVQVSRAKLAGVDDVVIVHADHVRLYIGTETEPPAAWDIIRDRLSR